MEEVLMLALGLYIGVSFSTIVLFGVGVAQEAKLNNRWLAERSQDTPYCCREVERNA